MDKHATAVLGFADMTSANDLSFLEGEECCAVLHNMSATEKLEYSDSIDKLMRKGVVYINSTVREYIA